jgi:hypothetical protein
MIEDGDKSENQPRRYIPVMMGKNWVILDITTILILEFFYSDPFDSYKFGEFPMTLKEAVIYHRTIREVASV